MTGYNSNIKVYILLNLLKKKKFDIKRCNI